MSNKMSKATVKDIMYLFKDITYIIWFNNGNCSSYKMNWDTCWKYCRDKKLLDIIPNKCSVFSGDINIWL